MARVTVTKDTVTAVLGAITTLVGKQVLIGVPESTTERPDDEPVNNATLAYIHEFGSPAANIPARPFLIPGVQKVEEAAVAQLEKAVFASLTGDPKGADQKLNAAGIVGMNGARDEISTGNFEPLSPATVYGRSYARKTGTTRPEEIRYLELVRGGMSPAAAQAETGIRPLINTGELRNSLTYVVRKKK